MSAAGLPSPYDEVDLRSLGQASEPEPRQAMSEITWEENERHGASMKIVVRRNDRKYIATFGSEKGSETPFTRVDHEELYDMASDPEEMTNLLEEGSADVAAFRREVRDYLDEVRRSRASGGGSLIQLDEELQERLRALGYVNP
jgi:arylsulfatase A-like enzyme